MATVRITSELIRKVENKIDNDHKPIEEKLDKNFRFPVSNAEIVEMCLVSFLAEQGVQRATFDGLPKGWKANIQCFELRSVNGVDVPHQFRYRSNLPSNTLVHHLMTPYNGYNAEGEEFEPMKKVVEEYLEARNEMVGKHKSFKQGVLDVLKSCTTLKQAVEAWPNLTAVLPSDILAKHLEPEVRAKAKKREITADLTDQLNAHATGLKITKALDGQKDGE